MLAKQLVYFRKRKGVTQQEVADDLGFSRATYAHYEIGRREPDNEMLQKLADYFDVSTDILLGRKLPVSTGHEGLVSPAHAGQVRKSSKMVEVPVYELDAKGEEILADSNIIGWHYVPAEQMDCICFRVPDDSMSGSGLYTDYMVTVIKQTTAEDGKIAIVKSKDGHFRIRRVRYFNDEVLLDPDNPRYQSERINISELVIIGVVTNASFKVI